MNLCTKIVEAWKRDIDRGNSEARAALSRLAVGRWKDNTWKRATMLVTRLVSAFWWRGLFLKPPALPSSVDPSQFTDAEWRALGEKMMIQNQRRAAEELETDDEFAVAAASALSTTLRSWFAGERELNYESFIAVLEWASS